MPKAIAPRVAQINIDRFKTSAIQSASGQKGPSQESQRSKAKTRAAETGKDLLQLRDHLKDCRRRLDALTLDSVGK
jgi:hypothetical protein